MEDTYKTEQFEKTEQSQKSEQSIAQLLSIPNLPPAPRLFNWALSFYHSHLLLILEIITIPLVWQIIQLFLKAHSLVLLLPLALINFIIIWISRIALFKAVVEENQTVRSAYQEGWQLFFPFIWMNILISLVVLGGTALFFIPGILFLIWLNLSPYTFFAEKRRGIAALIQSWHYTKGYWWSILGKLIFLALVFLVINLIIGLVTGGPSILTVIKSIRNGSPLKQEISLFSQLVYLLFNYLIVMPVSTIYFYGIYRSLRQIKEMKQKENNERKLKGIIIFFTVIGIIVLMIMIMLLIKGAFLMRPLFLKFHSL